MISNLEYALMAGNAYRTTRGEVNQIPIPEAQGWHEVLNSHIGYSTTGFEAISFQRMGANGANEIVISYAGTGTGIDWIANSELASGLATFQLVQAEKGSEPFFRVMFRTPSMIMPDLLV
ncbi:hypothetical protein ACFL48_05200 [Pseudomonadota bacterium]